MEAGKNHMKRALYVTNLGLMDNLGMTQILPYITGLAEKGIKFTVLSYEKDENLKNRNKVNDTKNTLNKYAVKWTALLYHNRWGNLYDIFVGVFRAAALILKDKIEVIHARASIPIIMGWPLARLFNRKIIYDRRGTMKGDFIDDVNLKNVFSFGFFSDIADSLDRFFVRHSNAVIVLTERSKELLKKNELAVGKGVICDFIPCCVEQERFRETDDADISTIDLNDKFVISYVGSLGTCYLLEEMVDFFKALRKERKNTFFLIVSHSDKEMINSVFSAKGVSERDYAVVHADPSEVPLWLGKSDCSIMFIKKVECKIGSSPTKFAESLASGVPVIINRGIGDAEDIVRTNRIGCIVESLDEKGYSKALSSLTELLKEGTLLKNRCKETSGRLFSIELGVEKYKAIYDSL